MKVITANVSTRVTNRFGTRSQVVLEEERDRYEKKEGEELQEEKR